MSCVPWEDRDREDGRGKHVLTLDDIHVTGLVGDGAVDKPEWTVLAEWIISGLWKGPPV